MKSLVKDLVEFIQKQEIPKERIEKRKANEDEAIAILTKNLGKLTKAQIGRIVELLDSDLWMGKIIRRRFGLLLWGRNRNLIIGNDEDRLNHFFSEVFGRENLDQVDAFISDLKGIRDGFASCLLYLKNREKYNILVGRTSDGIKAAFPKEPEFRGPFKDRYMRFNSLANELRKKCNLEPQEMDIILTVLPSWIEAGEEEVTDTLPTFSFTEKDFKSCTGKKKDAKYLKQRFVELEEVLRSRSDPGLENFEWAIPRPARRGSDKYRPNMWIGLADKGYLRRHEFVSKKRKQPQPHKGVQLQAGLNAQDPFFIEIFIDRWANDKAKMEAKNNIEKNVTTFLGLVTGLSGFYIGHSPSNEWPTEKFSKNDLREFLDDFDEYTYVGKTLSKKQVLDIGTKVVDEIIETWNQMLPVYKLMALGEIAEIPITVQPLDIHQALVKTELELTPDVVDRICANLNACTHVIVTGPVGTGKTTLAEDICRAALNNNFCSGYILTTATSDWTTFDTIGGYMPTEQKTLRFEEGKFLQAIRENKWLVVDEINRADIDKAFGQLFTVLSGQRVELPFKHTNEKAITIETTNEYKSYFDDENACYKVGKNWRIIATMNVYDKAFLFTMSYAFMRRFAFVYLDIPEQFEKLIDEWCKGKKISAQTIRTLKQLTKLSERKIGPAIIKDILEYIEHRGDGETELAEAIVAYILPQLEGLEEARTRTTWDEIGRTFVDRDVPNKVIKPIFSEIVGLKLEDIA